MRLFRTIVALFVALALATLPLGSAAMAMPIAEANPASGVLGDAVVKDYTAEIHGTQMSIEEPCHHTGKSGQAPQNGSKRHLSACCVGASIIAAPSSGNLVKPLVYTEGRLPARIDRFVPDHAGSRPFRPPRV